MYQWDKNYNYVNSKSDKQKLKLIANRHVSSASVTYGITWYNNGNKNLLLIPDVLQVTIEQVASAQNVQTTGLKISYENYTNLWTTKRFNLLLLLLSI